VTRHVRRRDNVNRGDCRESANSPGELRHVCLSSSRSGNRQTLPASCPVAWPGSVRCGALAERAAERSMRLRGRRHGRNGTGHRVVPILRPLASAQWRAGQTRLPPRPVGGLVVREWLLHPPRAVTFYRRGSSHSLEGDTRDRWLWRRRRGVNPRDNAACRVQWSVRDFRPQYCSTSVAGLWRRRSTRCCTVVAPLSHHRSTVDARSVAARDKVKPSREAFRASRQSTGWKFWDQRG
jgi:hypothetical protein